MNGWGGVASEMKEMAEEAVQDAKVKAAEAMLDRISTNLSYKGQHLTGATPIDSGNLLANTVVTINQTTSATNSDVDRTGSKTYLKGMSVVKKSKVWDVIHIQNNTEYNVNAEFIGWHDGVVPPYRYFGKAVQYTFDIRIG